MGFLLLCVHSLEGKEVGGGFFCYNIFSNQLVYMNWLLHPPIIRFNELLLESNHYIFHRVDILHRVANYICHILCCIFVRQIDVVRVTQM